MLFNQRRIVLFNNMSISSLICDSKIQTESTLAEHFENYEFSGVLNVCVCDQS